jgi:hypothetical protein
MRFIFEIYRTILPSKDNVHTGTMLIDISKVSRRLSEDNYKGTFGW